MAEHVVSKQPDVKVHGAVKEFRTMNAENILDIENKITLHECDINDVASLLRVVKVVKPDIIFHFEDYSNVSTSFKSPHAALANNILGTSNLFEAIRLSGGKPIFQLCSTSEVYGCVEPGDIPIKEDALTRPASPYAVSKTTQDLLGLVYYKSYGINIIRTRMFAYLNPRRMDIFSTSFARQIARIEAGLQEELVHGNLQAIRTIIGIHDAMDAYWVAALCCEPGEAYNIGSDQPISVGQFLELLKDFSKVKIKCRLDPALLRPIDLPILVPNLSKFQNISDWNPKQDLQKSALYLLNYWRRKVLKEGLNA